MMDKFGRTIDYLRISVTDRCNLRCRYCMPAEGVQDMGRHEILSYDEIVRIVRTMAGQGLKYVKLTGGEPLVRKGLAELAAELGAVEQIEEVTLTTNGILLKDKLTDLYRAGIRSINISLDTLNAARYERLTGLDALPQVLESVDAALGCEDMRLKINALALADTGEEDFAALAAMAKEKKVDVRFIEVMPVGMGTEERGIERRELLSILERFYGRAEATGEKRGNGPAEYFKFGGFRGRIGFISAVSCKFCQSCNRVRLTADGFLKTCLDSDGGTDLKERLRKGISDESLLHLIEETVREKGKGHSFGERKEQSRLMSQIGG